MSCFVRSMKSLDVGPPVFVSIHHISHAATKDPTFWCSVSAERETSSRSWCVSWINPITSKSYTSLLSFSWTELGDRCRHAGCGALPARRVGRCRAVTVQASAKVRDVVWHARAGLGKMPCHIPASPSPRPPPFNTSPPRSRPSLAPPRRCAANARRVSCWRRPRRSTRRVTACRP